jgi:hypothetical protein
VIPRRAAACVALAWAVGCGPSAEPSPAVVEYRLTPARPAVGAARLTVTVRDDRRRPITGAALRIEGHMTHPGMAPLLAAAVERGDGVYEAEVAFSMAGDWVLLVKGDLPDGRRLSRRIDVGRVDAPE